MKLEETIRGFAEILDGQHDDLPEDAFYMVGTIDQAVAKGRELGAESEPEPADAERLPPLPPVPERQSRDTAGAREG